MINSLSQAETEHLPSALARYVVPDRSPSTDGEPPRALNDLLDSLRIDLFAPSQASEAGRSACEPEAGTGPRSPEHETLMTATDARLRTTVSQAGSQVAVACSGEMDYATGPLLREALQAALAGRPDRITVDLSGVTFCDCGGMDFLLAGRQRAHAVGADFQVIGVTSPIVAKLISLLGLAKSLGIPQSEQDRPCDP